jgi:hypothetical protein
MLRIGEVGSLALLAVVCALLIWGCGSGAPTSPDPFRAGWDSLDLFSLSTSDTLAVLGDGTIHYRAGADASAAGLVSLALLRSLEDAVAASAMTPWDPAALPPSATGALRLQRGDGAVGFSWETTDELDPAQQRLITLLGQLRDDALGEGSERVDAISTAALVRGDRARVTEPDARVIRDGDALLLLMREMLGGEALVVPEIDFRTEMLLAVFGGRAAPGAEVHVGTLASRTVGGYLQVPVTLNVPAPECAPPGHVSPFEIVRLARMDIEIFFLWEEVTSGCLEEEL